MGGIPHNNNLLVYCNAPPNTRHFGIGPSGLLDTKNACIITAASLPWHTHNCFTVTGACCVWCLVMCKNINAIVCHGVNSSLSLFLLIIVCLEVLAMYVQFQLISNFLSPFSGVSLGSWRLRRHFPFFPYYASHQHPPQTAAKQHNKQLA